MKRAIVADDKAEQRYFVRAALQSDGWLVDEARDGAEALALARRDPPEMIVSDLLMPALDGYSLLREWRADERLRHIPFVVYTATYRDAMDQQLAFDLGADAFILKPVDLDVFLDRIRAVIATGRPARSLPLAPAPPDAVVRKERAFLAGPDGNYEGEFRLGHKDGSYRHILARGADERDAEGTRIRVTGSHVDITELRDTDVALGEDEQRLALVSDTVADVIYQIGVEQVGTYRFLSANAAFSRVTGLPLSAVVGRAVSDVIPEPSLSLVLSKYREAIEHRGIVQWEETTTYPNGRLTSEVRVAPVFDEMGVCTHLVGSMRDITARKHAERELARSHETALSLSQRLLEQQVGEQQRIADQLRLAELRNLALIEVLRRNNEALEEQVRLAREAMRHKSAFLANMSHELRTPLNGIMGFAELMYDGKVGPLAPHHREYLGDILASARHLLRLINDILDLAKVEFGRVQFVPEPLNLAEIVDEVCSVLSAFAQERRLHIEQDVEPLADIIADHAKVRQVIFNYLSNALKFSTEGGRVTVRVAADGPDSFRIEVRDHGVGVAPDDLKRLFVEFQQLDSGLAKEYAGTGLGLALTKRIVEAQGGSVGAESTPNVETRFFAVLPRQPKTVSSDAPSPHAVAEPSA